ncbi:unnamed protein product [Paramecium sonneborni]|uniref:Uncharacterized protein n=1 Tax=Paramecium sonneborni TaxID=65129 RepID=A0A8S1QX91_9CILI|nr:unnamed protein product [Paramecium sonneborni]CAD8120218.1 unnamed protein product [Paramecium sonneborni]
MNYYNEYSQDNFDLHNKNYSPKQFNLNPKQNQFSFDEQEINNFNTERSNFQIELESPRSIDPFNFERTTRERASNLMSKFIFPQEPQEQQAPIEPLVQQIKKQPIRQKIRKSSQVKTLGKNFPKQMGKYLMKHLRNQCPCKIPKGIQGLQEKAELMKQNGKKEVSFAIQDYKVAASSDFQSQIYLMDFVKNKLPIYLINSRMIEDPTKLYQFIHNTYVGICNPTKWLGNYQTESNV